MTKIVSAEWLADHINDKNLVVLDASIPPPASKETEISSVQTIPGARFANLKKGFANPESNFPNTVPTPQQFEEQCIKLGINNDSHIIIFDYKGVYSSPRLWWLFKIMGHDQVAVLDGGLPEWIKQGGEVSNAYSHNEERGSFVASYDPNPVKSYFDILVNVSAKTHTVVDARSEGRFTGSQPEPRKHLQSGSIPNSVNIPFQTVLHNGKFKSPEELRELFRSIVPDTESRIFSCGSGITACVLMLASQIAFDEHMNVYDGSWTELAELQNLIVE